MPNFLAQAQELFPYTQALRRDFHQHPELGFNEIRTSHIIAQELASIGIQVTQGVAKTGVIGLIEGATPGPTILLRFDMDALPITEGTGAEYSSIYPGIMHACGHDGHTAIGLAVAKMLHHKRATLAGNVKLCFQPSEEGCNGEEIGGNLMLIHAGVLDVPKVTATLALHLWNTQPLGWINIAAGFVMAGADQFTLKITGNGGHAARPDATIDPIVASAQIITALQTISSRNVAPLAACVVSVTALYAGTTFNVIPETATALGTIRTFDLSVRNLVLTRFEQIVRGIATAMNCSVEIEIKRIAPAVFNHAAVTASVSKAALDLFPKAQLVSQNYLTMGADDMGFMQEQIPGCYFMLGSANIAKNLGFGHHHPQFDFDEQVLISGSALMATAAVEVLENMPVKTD